MRLQVRPVPIDRIIPCPKKEDVVVYADFTWKAELSIKRLQLQKQIPPMLAYITVATLLYVTITSTTQY